MTSLISESEIDKSESVSSWVGERKNGSLRRSDRGRMVMMFWQGGRSNQLKNKVN